MTEPTTGGISLPFSRRAAIGLMTLGAAGVAGYAWAGEQETGRVTGGSAPRRPVGVLDNAVVRENRQPGEPGWRIRAGAADDIRRQVQGYSSSTSVNLGDTLDFHVALARAGTFRITFYRLGHYGGAGARRILRTEPIAGRPQPVPRPDPASGVIACTWPVSWTLKVPTDWTSGMYLAVFEATGGVRSCTPFVVRDDARRADFLMVLPFTTYQAYNFWPADGRTGKNLYKGYTAAGKVGGLPERAFQVSFDRPYSGSGLPSWWNLDHAAVQWAESQGFDVAYASSVDLHDGRVPPHQHAGLIFPGHDEYWSMPMRNFLEKATAKGTSVAFLAANNIYWHVRVDKAADGRPNRIVTCYKDAPDPAPDRHGATVRWRELPRKGRLAEQRLLGVQYNGMLAEPIPLVVQESGHWFWAGTGVRDGDQVPGLVAVEADGHNPKLELSRRATHTLLSNTPYEDRLGRGERTQNTSIYEVGRGAIVFTAGTFHWNLALVDSEYTDVRIQRAMKNLLTRMLDR